MRREGEHADRQLAEFDGGERPGVESAKLGVNPGRNGAQTRHDGTTRWPDFQPNPCASRGEYEHP